MNSHRKHTRKKIPVYSQRQGSFSFELLPTPVVIHVPRQLYSFIHPFPVSLLCSCAPTTDDFFASEWPAAGTGRLVAVGKKNTQHAHFQQETGSSGGVERLYKVSTAPTG
jgi:hypothetical protein